MGGPNKRITLSDVAREAGVSVQTASHVLSGNLNVRLPERTRARVREAAQRVGYQPNRLAQAMRGGKSRLIDVWVSVDRPSMVVSRFLREISRHAREDDYELLIHGLDSAMAYAAQGKMPTSWPVDGLIALDAGRAIARFRENPANNHIPVAVMGLESYVNSDSIAWDLIGGAREVTRRMIDSGSRHLVHLTLDWVVRDYPREQRRRGFSEVMEQAGLNPVLVPVLDETREAAAVAIDRYIDEHGVPEGVLGFTDGLAIGALRALRKRGVRVPEDCQIWGYGDAPESADCVVPISSMRLPIEAVTNRAWDWLLERVGDHTLSHRLDVLPMEFMARDSSR